MEKTIEKQGVDTGVVIVDDATTTMVRIKQNHDMVKCSDIKRESYMSAHVLLNLLNELASLAFYFSFATSLINSIIQEHEC